MRVLRFYQLRRHIEDIDAFYRQYLCDDLTDRGIREVITCFERACARLNNLMKDRTRIIAGIAHKNSAESQSLPDIKKPPKGGFRLKKNHPPFPMVYI